MAGKTATRVVIDANIYPLLYKFLFFFEKSSKIPFFRDAKTLF